MLPVCGLEIHRSYSMKLETRLSGAPEIGLENKIVYASGLQTEGVEEQMDLTPQRCIPLD